MENKENNSIALIEKTETKEEIKVEEVSKKSKLGLILLITVIFFVVGAIFSTIFAVINFGNDKIIKGVQIAQIDISKMTKEEAKKTLEEIYSKKLENEIYLKYGEFESTTTYEALEAQYKIDEALEQAYQIGRKGNLLTDNFEILKSWTKGIQIDLDVSIDKEMLNQVVDNINNSVEGVVTQPDYYQEGQILIITAGKNDNGRTRPN